jgi:hypothetical protein
MQEVKPIINKPVTCTCLVLVINFEVLSRHNFPYSARFSLCGFMSNLCSTFPSHASFPVMKGVMKSLPFSTTKNEAGRETPYCIIFSLEMQSRVYVQTQKSTNTLTHHTKKFYTDVKSGRNPC